MHQVLEHLGDALSRYPRAVVVDEVRRAIDSSRREILDGRAENVTVEQRVRRALAALEGPSLRRVINATGVVLHTNLGRAPLGAVAPLAGYSNLEYDLDAGRRGKRDVHVAALIERLTGAPGIAVNNNAAAVFLALNELAAGGEAVVSRGELIEIGDGFRIPDIMVRSGAVLREVGTTNRTTIDDYRQAITERTRLLLRVHPSNFRISGFTSRVTCGNSPTLGRERGIPVYEDLGSGCLIDLRAYGVDEPVVGESIAAGVDLVSFSGDKLLGGPQAGILAGHAEIVATLAPQSAVSRFATGQADHAVAGSHAAQPVAGTLGPRAGDRNDPRVCGTHPRTRAVAAGKGTRPPHRSGRRAKRNRRRSYSGAIHSHLGNCSAL